MEGYKLWGPVNLATGGGLGTPKARPRPPMGHLIAPTCCMLALVGQLGPWGHWVVAPGAHTSPLWAHATAQVDPIPEWWAIFKTCPLLRQHDMRCRVVGYLTTTFKGIIINIPNIILRVMSLIYSIRFSCLILASFLATRASAQN